MCKPLIISNDMLYSAAFTLTLDMNAEEFAMCT